LSEIIQNFLTAAGALILGGGTLVTIAYGFFKLFGEKWLHTKFEERLAAHRHAQQKELEELRFRINALFDRKTKLHQREYEVVPEAWSRLVDAHNEVAAFTSFLQSYADVGKMSEAQLVEFLSSSPLQNWEREELKASADKNKYYQRALFGHRYYQCREKYREAHVYVLKNSIFMPNDIRRDFNQLDGLLWGALNEHHINEVHDIHPRERSGVNALRDQGNILLASIEEKIQKQLRDDRLSVGKQQ
jgi:hypothetical protein